MDSVSAPNPGEKKLMKHLVFASSNPWQLYLLCTWDQRPSLGPLTWGQWSSFDKPSFLACCTPSECDRLSCFSTAKFAAGRDSWLRALQHSTHWQHCHRSSPSPRRARSRGSSGSEHRCTVVESCKGYRTTVLVFHWLSGHRTRTQWLLVCFCPQLKTHYR